MIQLTFYMEPVGKARVHKVYNPDKRVMVGYTPDKTVAAEEHIRVQVISWADKKGVRSFPVFENGLPLNMTATFVRSRPKSITRRITEPTSRPDLDNYAKLLLDALRGIIFADDSQIVGMLLEKEYVKDGALPRVEVAIWEESTRDQPVKQTGRRHKNAGK